MSEHTPLLIGVDSGGSKIDVTISDSRGELVAFATGMGGIPRRISDEVYLQRLQQTIRKALREIDPSYLDRGIELGIGLAGYDWPSQRPALISLLSNIENVTDITLVNDTIAALVAGTTAGRGICITAGTGCNCRGLDHTGKEYRIIGTGYMFAEHGSATSITNKAIEAIGREWIGGPKTSLTQELMRTTKQQNFDELIEELSTERLTVGPEFAPKVIRHAEKGDEVAQLIIDWAATELCGLVRAVANQFLSPFPDGAEIVAGGSLLQKTSTLWANVHERLRNDFPNANVRRLSVPAVLGALLITPTARKRRLRDAIFQSYAKHMNLLTRD